MPDQYFVASQQDAKELRRGHSTLRGRPRLHAPYPRRPRYPGRGGSVTTTTSVSIDVVLVDKDITGAKEADPAQFVTAEDIEETLTEEEVAAGYEVVFQDPIPDDDTPEEPNYDDNHVERLNLSAYVPEQLTFKVFETDPLAFEGSATVGDPTELVLSAGDDPSEVDEYYTDGTIAIVEGTGNGQSKKITAYDSDTHTVTVESAWTTPPNSTSKFEITLSLKQCLAYDIIDDAEHDPPRKIVRYRTITATYYGGDSLELDDYDQDDYPDYPDDEVFPPDGTGTYAELPEGFLKKKLRGLVINNVFLIYYCTVLPAPPLPLA